MQRNHGTSEGAKRFAEIISFIGTYYGFAQRYRDHCMLVAMQFRGPCHFQLIDNIIRGIYTENHHFVQSL
ncbi:hypothetical protein AAVH_41341 [Aphelenchoides avenae]|nr:hypothetical protein AAVH_41341 [Aphelenchus avenae]